MDSAIMVRKAAGLTILSDHSRRPLALATLAGHRCYSARPVTCAFSIPCHVLVSVVGGESLDAATFTPLGSLRSPIVGRTMPGRPICRVPSGVVIDATRVDKRVDMCTPTKSVRADDVYLRNSVEWCYSRAGALESVFSQRGPVTASPFATVLSPLGQQGARL
ncbi:hypothetical protein LSAT2_014058 [Lamellibrachia satsuma]|nr:hypothetical protein LSAT2_014058 [Lamellibrachia satsuma]